MGKTKSKSLKQGALIFAFNNEQTDYISLAAWNAQNIQRHLNLPVAVVTDDPDQAAKYHFDHIITSKSDIGGTRYFSDYKQTVTWYNAGRATAYELSPFEQTLLLDADYVVASDSLLQAMTMPQQLVAFNTALDPGGQADGDPLVTKFGNPRMQMWWATVMIWRKGNVSKYVFDCMQMIRANWQFYRHLFNIVEETYRNDYALSIAMGILAGHDQTVHALPWPMINIMPEYTLQKLSQDQYQIGFDGKDNQPRSVMLGGMDIHAMGKKHLETLIASS